MGVDCNIYLPHNVRIDNVADVIGRLLGCPCEKYPLTVDDNFWAVRVRGVIAANSPHVPGLANICVPARRWDVTYFFEHRKGRLLMGRSRPTLLALADKLVEFFGGSAEYTDVADVINIVRQAGSDDHNCPEDGEPWQDLQQRIYDLKPLTDEEVKSYRPLAAYPDPEP